MRQSLHASDRGLRCFFDKSLSSGVGHAAGNVLGRVHYGHGSASALDQGTPLLSVHMAGPGTDPFTEVWVTDRPVRAGARGDLLYAEDGEHIFCATRVPARDVYRDAVHEAYHEAFALIAGLGYTRPFRMWNLVGSITGGNADDMEIYQDFCVGRAKAFEEWSDRIGPMPAATGIGTLSPGIDLYFLASRDGVPQHLENPRQTPAYNYPDRYGPKSPSFARATYLRGTGGDPDTLYVSGTASIVGDDTVRHGDIAGQCEVTLANIEALIGAENLRRYGVEHGFRLTDLDHVKVYVRDAEHLPAVRARCAEAFAGHAEVAYLNVDVCRRDLLVEIEGICR
ncbi:pteridine-dependent deoxygenase like protein [Sphaerisporangium krabiense]|uniref:Chorismatase n=1 Tax=Sphaerisporangium krabiense TaxID=763782 RepID=A0A7W8Z8L8_9ACTN|nr:FkbO/Hyg5 family chorismatase [Sphaerisporangium krabiense]MBB5629463.1 chorismatase [Sphaerisporangium krabiense]GII65687.1 pteridine-dependent deoxygenase like protein [Sphaerisporangium krabiense]